MTATFLGSEGSPNGGGLSNCQKMECFLRVCADPGFQIGIGEELGIHRSTVSKILHEVMESLTKEKDNWIAFPTTPDDLREARRQWQTKYTFPLCIGAIDCTHVPIQRPPERLHPDEFINRKQIHSFNVQATVNADDMFTSVIAMWPGSVHDARIFRCSTIPETMVHTDALLLGDSGYGIAPYLMTPYRTVDKPEKRAFNRLFTKERLIVERVFGQLKKRFPILSHPVRIKHEKVPTLIVACCVLHNISKFLNDCFEEDVSFQEEQEDDEAAVLADIEGPLRTQGQRKRDRLADIIHQQLS